MTAPTQDELLLINCLLYSNDFEDGEGTSVAAWAEALKNSPAKMNDLFPPYPPTTDPDRYPNPNDQIGPGEMTRAEFENVLDSVIGNPNFQSMNIVDVDVRPGSPLSPDKQRDELVMTTIDYNGEPVVVFKGTGGDIQWRGNGTDGYYDVTDTLEQQYALNYFTTMMQQYPDMTAYVSGHSAGGNAAQYVTIMAGDQVSQCYSFDGPGFNPAFYAKYADLVGTNGGKIQGISNFSDFVGIQFDSMASVDGLDNDKYTGDGDLHGWDAHSWRRFHSPYTIFSPDGDVLRIDLDNASSTPVGPYGSMAIANDLIFYLEAFMPRKDFTCLCWWAMGFLIEKGYATEYGEVPPAPDDFFDDLLQYVKGYAELRGLDPYDVIEVLADSLYGFWDGPEDENPFSSGTKLLGAWGTGIVGTNALYTLWRDMPSLPYSMAPREFTQEILDQLLALVDETQAHHFFPVIGDWFSDLFAHVAKWFGGGVDFPADAADREGYYRQMIDMDNVSAQKFRQIWDDVAAKDAEFAAMIQGCTDSVNDVKRLADEFAEKIRTS